MFAVCFKALECGLRPLAGHATSINVQQCRNLFPYLRIAFNKVDEARQKEVGPDRLCAEWVLKNGGVVQFHQQRPVADYNALPPPMRTGPRLHTIDGTDSSIMAIGFEHLRGCTGIERIILNRCTHLENEALESLVLVKDTLTDLQVTECKNIENSGLLALKDLHGLKQLKIYGFLYVKDFDKIVEELRKSLPKCEIVTN